MTKRSIDRIHLIGYRGTGKTTVARLLAERLGWTCVDADLELESRLGRTIHHLFANEGEMAFRAHESELLAELCRRDHLVLATGGGVVLREENRELLRQTGRVVWLTADAETIWGRLQADAASAERRPDLTPLGGLAEVRRLLAVREPLYRECADVIVDTTGRAPEDITTTILSQL